METIEQALAKFVEAAQGKVKETGTRVRTMSGPSYIRIFTERNDDATTRSAYCFVEVETGNVLKASGWKAPEKKNPRSNIYSPDHGASGISAYGAVSLRRGY